jgi:hypothetical protein
VGCERNRDLDEAAGAADAIACSGWQFVTLVVQDDIKQRAVNLQPAVVVNKAQFPEPVHEKADPRAGCAYHLCQHLLADLGNYVLGCAFLAKMSEQQEDPGQPLFARIEN